MVRWSLVFALAATSCYLTSDLDGYSASLATETNDTDAGVPARSVDAEAGATDVKCSLGASGCPASNCKTLHAREPTAPSGVYELDPDGAGPQAPFRAYCDMVFDGGGFTLVLKVDGKAKTFRYDASIWKSEQPLNEAAADLDEQEAKLRSFTSVTFVDVLVGMLDGGTRRWLKVPFASTSMFAAMQGALWPVDDKRERVGRVGWESLLASGSLQTNCNIEGLNVATAGGVSVRIGIVGNNEADCTSNDSWIGVGGSGTSCDARGTLVAGDMAGCSADNGDRQTRTFAYVLVR